MKHPRLFAILLTMTLLLTACGATEETKEQPKQSTPPPKTAQTASSAETTALAASTDETATHAVPIAEETVIRTILLSSSNELSGHGSFIYITPTQLMIGRTTHKDIIKEYPISRATDLEQLQITEIPKEAFDQLCAELRAQQYDLLPNEIARPADHPEIEDASDYYLSVKSRYAILHTVEGYAATQYHEGFARIYETIHRHVESMIAKYAPPPTETKPIASILLSYSNGFSARTGFTYLSPTHMAVGVKRGGGIMKGDPIANPDGVQMTVAEIPEDVFRTLCAQLWEMRFDQLPREVTPPDGFYITDASDMYFAVRFEDGTEFVSSGYAADVYHEGFYAIRRWLEAHQTALMDEYGAENVG